MKNLSLAEVREKISEEVGYTITPTGYSDSGNRNYGASDDDLIKLTYEILTGGSKR